MRSISSPYASLGDCQRWISHHIVSRLPASKCVTAYVERKSILDHVAPHTGAERSLLVLDIQDFFPSITKRRVVGLFHSLGYNYEVSIALAGLCCLNGALPQGSPASPAISNQIARGMDRRIERICRKLELAYTRYADDICVSGNVIHSGVTKLISEAVHQSGFALNHSKTRVRRMNSTEKVLTGVNISSAAPRLPRSKRRALAHEMHFIEKFGYISHRQKRKISDPKYLLRLRGRLEFWRFVEPENAEVAGYIARIAELQSLHGDA